MEKTDKPRIEELAGEAELWNAYREVWRSRGFDVARLHAEWAAEVKQGLTSPGAREDFAELCAAGCLPQSLAVLFGLLRYSPLLERFWAEMVGQPSNRKKAIRKLENAAQTLEMLYGDVLALGSKEENERFTKIGRIPVSRMVSELRAHIKFIRFAETIRADTETHSPAELARYLLTGYVKRVTGDFHDRNVSGLLAEIVGPPDYSA